MLKSFVYHFKSELTRSFFYKSSMIIINESNYKGKIILLSGLFHYYFRRLTFPQFPGES